MTSEKRRQMQKLKEKALKIEERIRERKQRSYDGNELNNEDIVSQTSRSSLTNTGASNTQRSQDIYDSRIKETEESMILLQNLMKRQQTGSEDKPVETENVACNISTHVSREDNQEKLQKLQKSEILIYDNSTNEVIQVPPVEEAITYDNQQRIFKEVDRKLSLNNEGPKKPAHLLLAGVNSKGMASIPAICLNPPTPLTAHRNICDNVRGGESKDAASVSKKSNTSLDLADELSSDESFNSMITQTDRRSVRSVGKNTPTKPPRCGSVERITFIPVTPVKNVSAKIQQFEAISSESITPQSSPEKLYKTRKSCLGLTVATMSRSATSPSLKLNTSNRSSTSVVHGLGQNSDSSPENNLVRSSSFTLEGPSKVLIDHMQQQKQQQQKEPPKPITETKSTAKSPLNTTRSLARKSISSPLRAHRDTVESKAKKVQKVELKSSKLKIQQKASQSKLALAAAVSISPYNSSNLTQHSNNLCKTKRSPYDLTKTSQTSLQKTSSTQMRKSNSSSSNLSLTKTAKSRPSSANNQTPTSVVTTARTTQNDQDSLNHMEKTQKEKFLRLLAQQEEEHRRLQQSFEMQQKMLLEQLNREMAASHNKSPNNSISSGTCKKPEQRSLSPRLQNQLNLTGLSTDSSSHKPSTPSVNHTTHNASSPPSSSNNSSYLSTTKNSLQTCNFQYSSSYGSQYNHNSSQITLMDQSNANTSLDISTLSTQTSPDRQYITPTPTQHSIMDNNSSGNKTTSSSRRRLFSTEINGVESANNSISTRSSNAAISCHQTLQLQRNHNVMKSPKTLVNNGSNSRRVSFKFY